MSRSSRSGRSEEVPEALSEKDSTMLGPSDDKPRFQRLKPRVGSQFQHRVPKEPMETYEPLRPRPDLMPKDYDHVMQSEVQSMSIEMNGR
jgi:hypothetical protein